MRCAEVRENLVACLDGELGAEERESISSHLGACEDCRREADALERTGRSLSAWEAPADLPDLTGRVLAALGRRSRSALRRLLPLAAAATVLFLAGLAAVVLLRGDGSENGNASEDAPPADVLLAMELLVPETLDLLDEDPELLDLAEQIDWLESVSDDDLELLASLDGKGGK